jgi:anti-sigma regulatory factor (Ser/Thr protein kinase)
MTLRDVRRLLQADLVGGGDAQLDAEVVSACASDLMSDVLAFGRPGQVLLTGLTNAQSVRTADIIGAKAVIYVRGKRPDEECLTFAALKRVPLLATPKMMYEACGILYEQGLPGVCRPSGPDLSKENADTEALTRSFEITGRNFSRAGSASTTVKDILEDIGIDPFVIRRVAIAAYEAEMNVVMYAERGEMILTVTTDLLSLRLRDQGPGIPDIPLAMQEGYSTATPEMREMGFGAGMGLPNIKKNADRFEIASEIGRGTSLDISFHLRRPQEDRP